MNTISYQQSDWWID